MAKITSIRNQETKKKKNNYKLQKTGFFMQSIYRYHETSYSGKKVVKCR